MESEDKASCRECKQRRAGEKSAGKLIADKWRSAVKGRNAGKWMSAEKCRSANIGIYAS